MPVQISVGDCISGLALLLAGYATWKTAKFNERQESLIASQEKLNALLLDKETVVVANDKKADLGASFIKLGSSQHRLKIWNKGKAPARDVRIEFPDGNDVVVQSEINEKFPLESLDTFQSVELIAFVAMGTKRKHAIKLIWEDDFSDKNEKVLHPTI